MKYLNRIFYKKNSQEGESFDVAVDFDHVITKEKGKTITLKQWFDFMKENLKKVSTVLNDNINNTPSDKHMLWVDYTKQK